MEVFVAARSLHVSVVILSEIFGCGQGVIFNPARNVADYRDSGLLLLTENHGELAVVENNFFDSLLNIKFRKRQKRFADTLEDFAKKESAIMTPKSATSLYPPSPKTNLPKFPAGFEIPAGKKIKIWSRNQNTPSISLSNRNRNISYANSTAKASKTTTATNFPTSASSQRYENDKILNKDNVLQTSFPSGFKILSGKNLKIWSRNQNSPSLSAPISDMILLTKATPKHTTTRATTTT